MEKTVRDIFRYGTLRSCESPMVGIYVFETNTLEPHSLSHPGRAKAPRREYTSRRSHDPAASASADARARARRTAPLAASTSATGSVATKMASQAARGRVFFCPILAGARGPSLTETGASAFSVLPARAPCAITTRP